MFRLIFALFALNCYAQPWDQALMGALSQNTTDTRTFTVTDTNTMPWAMIGVIQAKQNGKTSNCTGTLITRHIVMTAAHCLYNINNTQFYKDYRFYPSNNRDGNGFAGIKPILPKNIAGSFDNNLDIGFLLLETSPIDAPIQNTLIPLSVVDKAHFHSTTTPLSLIAAGFPLNTNLKRPNLIAAITKTYRNTNISSKTNQFEHKAFTGEGSSGGAILAWHPDYQQLAVIGIISSERIWNTGDKWAVGIKLNTNSYDYMRKALLQFEPDWR